MEIKINANGYLEIKRGDKWAEQYCPRTSDGGGRYCCGDWCPLFGEPVIDGGSGKAWKLSLCQTTLYGQIEDRR